MGLRRREKERALGRGVCIIRREGTEELALVLCLFSTSASFFLVVIRV